MCIEERVVVGFKMKTLLKHNQRFYTYAENSIMCRVVRTIKRYKARTARVRGVNSQLLLSYIKPHAPISRATLARWTINGLNRAGIKTERYKGHSTSSAKAMGANLNAIMRNASWRDSKSFAKYYHTSIEDLGETQRLILNHRK